MRASFWSPAPGGSAGDLNPPLADRLRRFVRARLMAIGAYAVFLVAALSVTFLIEAHQNPDRHPDPWVLGGLIIGFPLVFALSFLVVTRRSLLRPTPMQRLVVSGDVTARKRVGRVLRKGLPLDDADRPVAQAQVDVLEAQRRLMWWLVPFAIACLALLLLDAQRRAVLGLALVFLVTVVGVASSVWWSTRRFARNAAAQGITPTPRS